MYLHICTWLIISSTFSADYGSEGDRSSPTPDSSIHTEVLGSQRTGSPCSVQSLPVTETHLASIQESPVNYTQDFTSASQSNIKQVCLNMFCFFFICSLKCYVPCQQYLNIVVPKVTSISERETSILLMSSFQHNAISNNCICIC